jgi:tetratricopeptide (TPR) repeat protein
MHRVAILLICTLLGACATKPAPLQVSALLHDSLVAPATQTIDADQVFAMSPAMARYAETELARTSSLREPRRALIDALYSRGKLRLSYDAGATRTAAEAFEQRAGNCLSLVIMTAAFASHLGLPVTFQSVLADDAYSRIGDLYLVSGHVNLVLTQSARPVTASLFGDHGAGALTVDFLPAVDLTRQRTRPIDRSTIVAMFMNNRAAESLSDGRPVDAYWWAREALRQDPGFLPGANTLAVAYSRLGLLPQAESALRHVLVQEPLNTSALSNLARLLERTERPEESRAVAERLASVQPVPPFHYYDLARHALAKGDVEGARRLLSQELHMQPYQHEVHFLLGVVYARMGQASKASRHLTLALDNSTTRESQALYSAKLDKLRSFRLQ